MMIVPIRLHGYIAHLSSEYKHLFMVRESQLVFDARLKRKIKKDMAIPLYREMENGSICVPLGIIMHYNRNLGEKISFKITERTGNIPFKPLDYSHPAITALAMDDWQRRAIDAVKFSRGGLLEAPTGSGKCHRVGERVMLHTGHSIAVEDVKVGDLLMGPDSEPRRVLDVGYGRGEIYKFTTRRGDSFEVNAEHILRINHNRKQTRGKKGVNGTFYERENINMTVADLLSASKHSMSHEYTLVKSGIELPEVSHLLTPYFVGAMLGDGSVVRGAACYTADAETKCYMVREAESLGLKAEVSHNFGCDKISFTANGRGSVHVMSQEFRRLGMHGKNWDDKSIPDEYKYDSFENRLQLLAGLLDTDGHLARNSKDQHPKGFEFSNKSHQLAEDVVWLARSLGFHSVVSYKETNSQYVQGSPGYRVHISGHLDRIPTKIARKQSGPRRIAKDPLLHGIRSVEPVGEHEWYGFEVEGDHLYLDDDFFIHHNSRPLIAISIAAALQHNVLFATPGTTVEENFTEAFRQVEEHLSGDVVLVDYDYFRANPGRFPNQGCIIYAGSKAVLNDAISGRASLGTIGTLIADEAHHGSADTYQEMLYALPNLVRSVGLSATVFEGKQQTTLSGMQFADASIIAAHGPLLLRIKPQEVKHRIDLPDVANLRFQWKDTDKTYGGSNWPSIYKMVKGLQSRLSLIASTCLGLSALDRVTVVPIGDKEYGRRILARCAELGDASRICCWFGSGEFWSTSGKEQVDIDTVKDYIDSGQYNTMIVTSHVDESLDVPAIDTAFLTEGRKARRSRQRAGRSVRRGAGAKSLVVNLWDLDSSVMQSQSSGRCNALVNYYETKKYRFDALEDLISYIGNLQP
jgi:hypothetical protein